MCRRKKTLGYLWRGKRCYLEGCWDSTCPDELFWGGDISWEKPPSWGHPKLRGLGCTWHIPQNSAAQHLLGMGTHTLSRRLEPKVKPSVLVWGRMKTTRIHFNPNVRHVAGMRMRVCRQINLVIWPGQACTVWCVEAAKLARWFGILSTLCKLGRGSTGSTGSLQKNPRACYSNHPASRELRPRRNLLLHYIAHTSHHRALVLPLLLPCSALKFPFFELTGHYPMVCIC